MRLAGSVLDSRATFELAALFVTWVVVALLVIVIGSLHARLRRLEQGGATPAAAPYGHLLGRSVGDIVAGDAFERLPRVLFFLSSGCTSCHRLLGEITSTSWMVPSAIAWTDGDPSEDALASDIPLLAEGPRISAELNIRVTPFALVADDDGRVVRAGPVSGLRSLGDLNGRRTFTRSPLPIITERGI